MALMDGASIAISLEEIWCALYLESIPWIDASKNHLQILAYDLSSKSSLEHFLMLLIEDMGQEVWQPAIRPSDPLAKNSGYMSILADIILS